jgi:hypothetical protein
MRIRTLLAPSAGILLACGVEGKPTEPSSIGSAPSQQTAAAASNTWSLRAPRPGAGARYEAFAGTAPNAAGQSIVYLFGGRDDQGGAVFGTSAYNVSTDTWTGGGGGIVQAFAANGVGKIADRLYFGGGYNEKETPGSFTNRFWAYDYANGQLIPRAPLPIFGAEGVSGVIAGKLYVLPGACSGDRWPVDPRYCAEEPTRRLFRYNPATNMWVSKRQAPHVHRAGAAGVIGDKLYVVGGFNSFTPVSALDVYNPGTNSWRTLAPIPQPGHAIGAVLQGKLHVLVGTKHFAYDLATNRWRTLASSQFGHDALLRVQLNGRAHLLAVGGNHGPNLDMANPSELYTP